MMFNKAPGDWVCRCIDLSISDCAKRKLYNKNQPQIIPLSQAHPSINAIAGDIPHIRNIGVMHAPNDGANATTSSRGSDGVHGKLETDSAESEALPSPPWFLSVGCVVRTPVCPDADAPGERLDAEESNSTDEPLKAAPNHRPPADDIRLQEFPTSFAEIVNSARSTNASSVQTDASVHLVLTFFTIPDLDAALDPHALDAVYSVDDTRTSRTSIAASPYLVPGSPRRDSGSVSSHNGGSVTPTDAATNDDLETFQMEQEQKHASLVQALHAVSVVDRISRILLNQVLWLQEEETLSLARCQTEGHVHSGSVSRVRHESRSFSYSKIVVMRAMSPLLPMLSPHELV